MAGSTCNHSVWRLRQKVHDVLFILFFKCVLVFCLHVCCAFMCAVLTEARIFDSLGLELEQPMILTTELFL